MRRLKNRLNLMRKFKWRKKTLNVGFILKPMHVNQRKLSEKKHMKLIAFTLFFMPLLFYISLRMNFGNNDMYADKKNPQFTTFTHFTFEETCGRLMITDI